MHTFTYVHTYFLSMPYFSFSTQTMRIKSTSHNNIDIIPLHKHLIGTLSGFEPGSSVPMADAMSTAPRRRD
jgi:hypothetical protein